MSFEGRRIEHPDLAHIDWFSSTEQERALALHGIPRFGTIENMTHRTSVLIHSLRVVQHTIFFSDILGISGLPVDQRKTLFMADHHDDAEIKTGDISGKINRNTSPSDNERIRKEERSAAQSIESIISKPKGFKNYYPTVYEELERQETLEAQIVQFADKWDGLHEAIHEVTCGENRQVFERVIEEYRPVFAKFRKDNEKWQGFIEQATGDPNFFAFPDPGKLASKTPGTLYYSSADSFIKSVAERTTTSYWYWLRCTKSFQRLDFLALTFPGWMDKFPKGILNDIARVKARLPYKETASGLLVPSTVTDPRNLTFGESLAFDIFLPRMRAQAMLADS